MKNKEYYGKDLEITIQGKYSLIYYRKNNIMKLLQYYIGDNIFEETENWLNKEYNGFSYIGYKEEKMNEKITYEYNEKNTVCYLEINNKLYIGKAFCHKDDDKNYRKSIGEDIAKYRAYIKNAKDEMNALKVRVKEATHLYNVINQSPRVEENHKSLKIIQKRIWGLESELADWNDVISILESAIAESANAVTIYAGLRSSTKKD